MNKYVLRTSVVWIALIAGGAGLHWYRTYTPKRWTAQPASVQPVAVGSGASQSTSLDKNPNVTTEAPLGPVQLTPERMQSIGVESGKVEWKQLADHIRATGTVDTNERLVSYVQVRFSGYIRKVFANATYQFVKKGDPLFTIYSPDLVATQNEYVLALRDENLLRHSTVDGVASGARALTSAAEARLRQWDIPQAEIAAVKESRQAISDLQIDSPVSGYITECIAEPVCRSVHTSLHNR